MTSVVDTSVKYFHSSMVNAPVLNGVVGAGMAVLDACLVNGFDLKTATSLVVLDGVATLSFSGTHSAQVDAVILVSGSSITALNGEQKVTNTGAGVVRFATAASNGTASGTITFKIASLGWSKVFSGTNKAVYKSNDPMSYGMYLRVDDTATQVMRVVGYESMSDVDTGGAAFPTTAQASGGMYWGKSSTASTNPVTWAIIGDSRAFFTNISIYTGQSAGANNTQTIGAIYGFGDMIASRPSGDPYACAMAGCISASWSTSPTDGAFDYGGSPFVLARAYTGLGESVRYLSIAFTGTVPSVSGQDALLGVFPSPIDGSLRLSRKYLRAYDSGATVAPRAEVPGLLHIPQSAVPAQIPRLSRTEGSGDLAGRRLLALNVGTGYSQTPDVGSFGVVLFDITGPWR